MTDSFTDEQAMEVLRRALITYNSGITRMSFGGSQAAATIIRDTVRAEVAKALERAVAAVETQTDYTTITPFVHRERAVAAIRALQEPINATE